ncbi:MAG: T9SS type A sorting domain-containing protein [Flavobacteriales bacterium]
MNSFYKILFSLFFFSFLSTSTYADCPDLGVPTPTANISFVEVGGNYFARVLMNDSSLLSYSGVTATVTTSNMPSIVLGSATGITLNPGLNTIDFPLLSDIANITSFVYVIDIEFVGGGLNCTEEDVVGFINTANWGCTDPTALNYSPSYTFNNNTCIYTMCEYFQVLDVSIAYNVINQPTLQVTFVNTSPYNLIAAQAIPAITFSNPPISISTAPIYFNVNSGEAKLIQIPITSSLSNLTPDILLVSGSLSFILPGYDNCDIEFNFLPIDITNLGCTDPTAFNYDNFATVDDENCVADVTINQIISNPYCEGNSGSVILDVSGGTPNYNINYNGFDPNDLLAGTYVFEVSDNTSTSIGGPIVKPVTVVIDNPSPFVCSIQLLGGSTFQATVNKATTGYYHWLLDGVVIATTQANIYTYTTPGEYACYVETAENAQGIACWTYSNAIVTTVMGQAEMDIENSFTLYPNPSKGLFQIELSETFLNDSFTLELIDIQGRVVYNEHLITTALNKTFNLDLNSGVYQIVLKNERYTLRNRLVIQ